MRMGWRRAASVAAVIASLVCAAFCFMLGRSPVFEAGTGYELYCGASSSARIVETADPVREKLLRGRIAGESVRYEGDRVEALLARFRAEVLFTEEAGGVTHYYCRSPLLKGGVLLFGYVVNLHVARSAEQTAAGTPLIFGGV